MSTVSYRLSDVCYIYKDSPYMVSNRTLLCALFLSGTSLHLVPDVCRVCAPQFNVAPVLQLWQRVDTTEQDLLNLVLKVDSFLCKRHVGTENAPRSLECIPDYEKLKQLIAVLVEGIGLSGFALVVGFCLCAVRGDAAN